MTSMKLREQIPPFLEQRVPNTLSPSDLINQEEIPWCFYCKECHRECPKNKVHEGGEDPKSYECMNLVEYMDPTHVIPRENYTITSK